MGRANLGGRLAKLISFDFDGTLEVGEPPGGITMNMVRQAKSCCAEQGGIYAKGWTATRHSLHQL